MGISRAVTFVGVAAAALGSLCASAQPATGTAPAFSGKQLTAWPTDNWITNGGNVYNQR